MNKIKFIIVIILSSLILCGCEYVSESQLTIYDDDAKNKIKECIDQDKTIIIHNYFNDGDSKSDDYKIECR